MQGTARRFMMPARGIHARRACQQFPEHVSLASFPKHGFYSSGLGFRVVSSVCCAMSMVIWPALVIERRVEHVCVLKICGSSQSPTL